MPERRDPEKFLAPHITASDGRLLRSSGRWARDKLAILAMYAPEFVRASQQAIATYFVDGLAGPGLCEVRGTGEVIRGSTLIALHTVPPFTRVIAMDKAQAAIEALKYRTVGFGERAVVKPGDVNADLLPLMQETVEHRSAPMLIFLDPEGFELEWHTVAALSTFRAGQRKPELLILAMTSAIPRVLGARELSRGATHAQWALPPGPAWDDVADRLRTREITPERARMQWARAYEASLRRDLGYKFVRVRAITRQGEPNDASIYHLVFASDHPAGDRIMAHAFERVWVNLPPAGPTNPQLQFDLNL